MISFIRTHWQAILAFVLLVAALDIANVHGTLRHNLVILLLVLVAVLMEWQGESNASKD